jgi:hypothetical protein
MQEGIECAEYKILLPENVNLISVEANPAVSGASGSIDDPGVAFCFPQCQYDPVWTHRVICEVTDNNQTFIFPDYYEGSGPNEGTDCSEPAGTGEIRARGPFGVNVPVAVDESSWGAIKAVYPR